MSVGLLGLVVVVLPAPDIDDSIEGIFKECTVIAFVYTQAQTKSSPGVLSKKLFNHFNTRMSITLFLQAQEVSSHGSMLAQAFFIP